MNPPRFRAWHMERKEMYAVRTIAYADGRVILGAQPRPRIVCRFDEVEIMLACPIPDKNGNQLYESDLVFVDYGHDDKKLMKIIYRPDFGWDVVRIDRADESDFILDEDSRFLELAGNIYENPELLSPHVTSEPSPIIGPAPHYGDKKRAILDAVPRLLTQPMTASEFARKLDCPMTASYVYTLMSTLPNVRRSKVTRGGIEVTAFELITPDA